MAPAGAATGKDEPQCAPAEAGHVTSAGFGQDSLLRRGAVHNAGAAIGEHWATCTRAPEVVSKP